MVMSNDRDMDVTFEIVEQIGVIGDFDTGWTKELNLVAWNGGVPRYDIREWAPDHKRMSRGVTFEEKEMRQILNLFKRRRTNSRFAGGSQSGGHAGVDDFDAPADPAVSAEECAGDSEEDK